MALPPGHSVGGPAAHWYECAGAWRVLPASVAGVDDEATYHCGVPARRDSTFDGLRAGQGAVELERTGAAVAGQVGPALEPRQLRHVPLRVQHHVAATALGPGHRRGDVARATRTEFALAPGGDRSG